MVPEERSINQAEMVDPLTESRSYPKITVDHNVPLICPIIQFLILLKSVIRDSDVYFTYSDMPGGR